MKRQVKTSNYKELNNFTQYIEHEYDQTCKQTHHKKQLAAEGKAGLGQGSVHDYVLAAETLMSSKCAQLQEVRAEAASR